jgi:ribokinase
MKQPAEFDVIGFGALNLDLIYTLPDIRDLTSSFSQVKAGSEVSVGTRDFDAIVRLLDAKGTLQARSGGGQAANTLFSLDRLLFRTGYVGKVGSDEYGDFLLTTLGEMDTRGIVRQGTSGVCLSVLGQDIQERTNIIAPNTNDTLSYEDIDVRYLAGARVVHMTSFVGDQPLNAQKRIAAELPDEVAITFDPNEVYTSRPLTDLLPIVEKARVLFLTDREVMLLTGKSHLANGVKALLDCGPDILVCKKGYRGATIYSKSEGIELDVPAKGVQVVDKTGAGDVFAAGFIAGMLSNLPTEGSAKLASEMAAASITGYGRTRYPSDGILRKYRLEAKTCECSQRPENFSPSALSA